MRSATGPSRSRKTPASCLVTGQTAINIDTAEGWRAPCRCMPVVVSLALLLLMIVFRSIVVPIKAALDSC